MMKVTRCNLNRALAAVIAVLWLAACTPELNWREMPAADGALRATFPARPELAERALPAGPHELAFHLSSAQAAGGVFAIGHARLPAALNESERAALRDALASSLSRNLQASSVQHRSASLLPLAGPGRAPLQIPEIEIQGQAGETPAWILARVFVLDGLLVQAAVIGPPEPELREAAEIFLDSLRMR